MENIRRWIKPHGGHVIKDRKTEIFVGLIMFLIGTYLLWDAFDNRGKKMPWPASAVAPW